MAEKKVQTRSRFYSAIQILKIIAKSKRSVAGITITAFFIIMATIGVEIIPLDLSKFNLSESYLPPSWEHPFGTDYFGRDVWAMIVHGSRDVLLVSSLAALITVGVGVLVGTFSGISGGKTDMTVMSIIDVVLTIPSFPLLIVLAAVIQQATNPFLMACILSVTAWASIARGIRSQVLSIKERGFIEAARCLGLSKLYIIINEVMPNLMSYIVVSFIISMTGAIYAQVGLFTLGLAPYSTVNWGMMLNMAMSHAGFGGAIWAVTHGNIFAPIFAITLLDVGLIMMTGAVEEIFNPRLRED